MGRVECLAGRSLHTLAWYGPLSIQAGGTHVILTIRFVTQIEK